VRWSKWTAVGILVYGVLRNYISAVGEVERRLWRWLVNTERLKGSVHPSPPTEPPKVSAPPPPPRGQANDRAQERVDSTRVGEAERRLWRWLVNGS
jgi:hypothetical protein